MQVLNKILEFNNISKDNIKIQLMKNDSFAFFRGTSHLFFEHLVSILDPKVIDQRDLQCYIQGDAHIGNLGFTNKHCSSIEDIKFNINDFDESFFGNPFLDIVRFGVSIGFFFDNLNNSQNQKLRDIDFIYKDTVIIDYFLEKYFKYITKDKHIKYPWKKSSFMQTQAKKAFKRTNIENPKSRINKFTKIVNNKRVFDFSNEKIEPLKNKDKLIKELKKQFDFNIIDICTRKSAGVGSSHLKRYYMLIKDEKEFDILLEIKEQLMPSFLNYFTKNQVLLKDKSSSQIHIDAKKAMLNDHDIYLETFSYENKDFLIKSIFNAKYSIDSESFMKNGIENFERNLKEYINFCAIALSNAHKKSAVNRTKFIKAFKKVKKIDFYKMDNLILKSYSTNIMFYSHFVRDLKNL
jgi:hypothetical protein